MNFDPPIGSGLDCVTLANRVANHDLNGNAIRTREGAAPDRRLNCADCLGEQGNSSAAVIPVLDARRN